MHATADRHLVVCHDATVDRTTDGTGDIAALTLEQLRRLDNAFRWAPGADVTEVAPAGGYPFRGRAPAERAFGIATLDLNRIPELQTVEHPAGRFIRSVYLGMQDATAPSVVEGFAEALILKNGASPVGGCGDGALALAPADEDGGEMILCHSVTRRSSGGNARPGPAGKRWP